MSATLLLCLGLTLFVLGVGLTGLALHRQEMAHRPPPPPKASEILGPHGERAIPPWPSDAGTKAGTP